MDQLHFDARVLPPEEAFDRWRVGVADFALSQQRPREPFDGTSTITSLGGIIVSESDLPPLRFVRTAAMIVADGHDLWSLSLVLTGGMRGDTDGLEFDVRPGQIALFSHSRPTDIRTERGRTIVLAIPGPMLDGVEPETMHGALPDTTATRLLADYLQALCRALPTLAPEAGLPAARALLALIQAAVASGPRRIVERRAAALRRRVIEHIEARLAAPIDAGSLCTALGVSRSALYRATRHHGGLQPLLRKIRLQEAHRALGDPADGRSIQQIARSVGYPDSTLFSRHFRAAFGQTAAALRKDAVVPPLVNDTTDDIPQAFRAATDRMFRDPAAG